MGGTFCSDAGLSLKKNLTGKIILTITSPGYMLLLMPIMCKTPAINKSYIQLPQTYIFGLGAAVITVAVTVTVTAVVTALIIRNKFTNNY